MMLRLMTATILAAALTAPVLAADKDRSAENRSAQSAAVGTAPLHAPPGGNYKKVSELVPLPDFVPGLGTLYVQPDTLPAGPFLGYDHQGKLVTTTYMIPQAALEGHKNFEDLGVAKGAPVDHVEINFNEGHPGVAEPHYHVVLWHVPSAQAAQLR